VVLFRKRAKAIRKRLHAGPAASRARRAAPPA
jgi:hypothetical protein